MRSRTVARRYARGLLGAVVASGREGAEEMLQQQLEALAGVLRRHGALRLVLVNPAIHAERKVAILEELGERLGLDPLLRQFLRVVAEKERLDHLDVIAAVFGQLVDEHRGVVRAEVRTAWPLRAQEVDALSRSLAEITGRQVRIGVETDPDLLGGLVARVGDTVYDGSLRSQLRRVEQRLAGA